MGWRRARVRGGPVRECPLSMVSWGPDRVDVFGVTDGDGLGHWSATGQNWARTGEVLGGPVRPSAPASLSWGPGRLDVVAVGAGDHNGQLGHWWWNGTAWGGPEWLGGDLSNAGLTAVSWGPNRIDVFGVRNPDGLLGPRTLQHWWYDSDGTGWHGPESLGGRLLDRTPSVVSWGSGRLDVFAVGADDLSGRLVHWWYDGGWNGPEPLAGERDRIGPGGPVAVSWARDRLDVFAVGTPESAFGPRWLHHWWWGNGGWGGPEKFTGDDAWLEDGRPAAVSWAPGRLDVFAVGNPVHIFGTRMLKHFWWDGTAWHRETFDDVAGLGVGGPAAVAFRAQRLDVAAVVAGDFVAGRRGAFASKNWDPAFQRLAAPRLASVRYQEPDAFRVVWEVTDTRARRFHVLERGRVVRSGQRPDEREATITGFGARGQRACFSVVAADNEDEWSSPSNTLCETTPGPVPPPIDNTRVKFTFILNGDFDRFLNPTTIGVSVVPSGRTPDQAIWLPAVRGVYGWMAEVRADAGPAGVWAFRWRVRGQWATGADTGDIDSPIWTYDWQVRSPAAYTRLDSGGTGYGMYVLERIENG